MYSEHPVCGTQTGISCCGKASRKTDLANYGVGIALYFQFLKYIAWLLFVTSLLSLPAYIFFYSGNSSSLQQVNVKNLLTTFSLGNIGQSQYACNSA